MANKKTKSINMTIAEKGGAFSFILNKFKGEPKTSEISRLRSLLSNEKARLLHICKTKKPESIYQLAKFLGRDFKAVRYDVKLLEELGFIELVASHKKGRERLMPIVDTDQLVITINI